MASYQAPIPPLVTSPTASPQDRVRLTAPSFGTPRPMRRRRTSVFAAVLLALFLGPIGLAYASVTGAAITAALVLLIGAPIAVFYPPGMYVAVGLVSPLCVVWAAAAALAHNVRQRHAHQPHGRQRCWVNPSNASGGYSWRTQ